MSQTLKIDETLTLGKIEELASWPGVRRIAVENFLGTLDAATTPTKAAALANLNRDARLYGWSENTIAAIKEGIRFYYGY
jgi:hypothetical protein